MSLEPPPSTIKTFTTNWIQWFSRVHIFLLRNFTTKGNLGIGEDPKAWGVDFSVSEIDNAKAEYVNTTTGETGTAHWCYHNGTNWVYVDSTHDARRIYTLSGDKVDTYAASGTADATITWITHKTLDSNGAVTKPLQPAFLARPSAAQLNIAVGVAVTLVLGSEVTDQGGDFAGNVFTAPVTGNYQLDLGIMLENIDTAAYYQISLVTSNRTYTYIAGFDSTTADKSYHTAVITALADMDAGDTASVTIVQNTGTVQTDIAVNTHFSGHLAN